MLGTRKKSFSIAYKLATLCVLGLAVAVVALTPYILHLNEGIRLAERERDGLDPVVALTQLIQQLQQHRGLSTLLLGGNPSVQDARTAKQRAADTSADKVTSLVQAASIPQLAARWTEVAQDWHRLENDVAAKTLTAPESYARHVILISRVLDLLDAVVDLYQLSLDSGADANPLIRGAMTELPRLTEALGQTRARGAAYLAAKHLDPSVQQQIMLELEAAKWRHGNLSYLLKKALTANPALEESLGALIDGSLKRTEAAVQLTQAEILESAAPDAAPAAYFAQMTNVIDGEFELVAQAQTKVGQLLTERVARLKRARLLAIVAAGLLLALSAVVSVLIAESIKRPLRVATTVADAVASGKLDNRIAVTARDETGQLLTALDRMQQGLRDAAVAAADHGCQIAAIGKAQAVTELDLDGTIRAANENLLRIMGFAPAEILGRHEEILVDRADRTALEYHSIWEKLGRGECAAGQYRRLAKGGREVWLQATYNLILGVDGKPYKVVQHATDVTDQVKMKSALDMAVSEAQAVVRAALDGDLAARIAMTGKTGAVEALAGSINTLVENMMRVVAQIKWATAEIRVGASEIAKGTADLSRRTEEQASGLEETASSMEEMTSAVKQSAENVARARELAVAAKDHADEGGTVVNSAVVAIGEINSASNKIAAIIGVIDDIAFQTNLLALNAAVEAARAGEQGRGFAVVATEVRALAGRSATAAKEIKALINDSVAKVEEGSRLVHESGKALSDIATSVGRVTDIVREIAQASQEQASGIDQVNKAVMRMDEMTQQNAAVVEQATAASSSILNQVSQLAARVAKYQVEQESAPRRAA